MSNIIEDFKQRGDVIKIYDWMKINKNLTNFNKNQVSLKNNSGIGTAFNIDVTNVVVNALINELNQYFIRDILKSMFSTPKFDYLDLRPDGSLMTGRVHLEKLVQMIYQSGYKNVVTTGLIASELQDSVYFSSNGFQHASMNATSTFYNLGSLNGVKIWVDPYMKFNDGRLCLFNEVDINIEDVDLVEVINPSDMQSTFGINCKYDFMVNDSKLIFVIENENSEAYIQYKSLQRDIKIDNILDGGITSYISSK